MSDTPCPNCGSFGGNNGCDTCRPTKDPSFGERLKKAMEMHGMTQVEFAEKSGKHPMEINHWVSGRREPSIANLSRLLKALPRARAYWLITGENLRHNAEVSHRDRERQLAADQPTNQP